MRYWIYAEPVNEKSVEPIFQIFSDKAILASYWEYWCKQMRKVNKPEEMTEANCIDDWVAVHWAVLATTESMLRIISAPKA